MIKFIQGNDMISSLVHTRFTSACRSTLSALICCVSTQDVNNIASQVGGTVPPPPPPPPAADINHKEVHLPPLRSNYHKLKLTETCFHSICFDEIPLTVSPIIMVSLNFRRLPRQKPCAPCCTSPPQRRPPTLSLPLPSPRVSSLFPSMAEAAEEEVEALMPSSLGWSWGH